MGLESVHGSIDYSLTVPYLVGEPEKHLWLGKKIVQVIDKDNHHLITPSLLVFPPRTFSRLHNTIVTVSQICKLYDPIQEYATCLLHRHYDRDKKGWSSLVS